MAEVTIEMVYAEVKRMRKELNSLKKTVESIAEHPIPEVKISPKERTELKALKEEALRGECVSFEEVLKKHGAKKSA